MTDALHGLRRAGSGMTALLSFALLAGLVPGLPIALFVGSFVGDGPDAELALAAQVGLVATDVLRQSLRELAAVVRAAPLWCVLVAVAAAVPQAGLAAQLGSRTKLSLLEALSLGVRRLSSLLALSAAHLFARVVLTGIVIFFATVSPVVAKTHAGEVIVVALVVAVGLALAGVLRHVLDVAWMHVLVAGARADVALLDALSARGSTWRALGSLVAASSLGVVSCVVAVVAASEIGATTPAQACVGAVLRLLALASLVVTRSLWLSIAAARV